MESSDDEVEPTDEHPLSPDDLLQGSERDIYNTTLFLQRSSLQAYIINVRKTSQYFHESNNFKTPTERL